MMNQENFTFYDGMSEQDKIISLCHFDFLTEEGRTC